MEDERSSYPKPGQEVLLKENPAPQIRADADRALAASRQARETGDTDSEASFARCATLLYFVTLEGLINFIYEWSEVSDSGWKSWSIARKWLNAAEQCRPGLGLSALSEEALAATDLFPRFLELKEVRNSMVHSQAVFTVLPEDLVTEHLDRPDFCKLTGLPRRLTLFRYEHAETARNIATEMTSWLDRSLDGASTHLHSATAVVEFVVEDHDSDIDQAG